MNVFAVATILEIRNNPESTGAWLRIQEAFLKCGLVGPGLLHFSWHVADSYRPGQIEDCLRETARDLSVITTASTGLGIFTSEHPVLYLPVSKTRMIADMHELLWRRLGPIAENVNPYYDPSHWIPHITLAYEDAQPDQISQAASSLLKQRIVFQLKIDHIALIYRNGVKNGIVTSIPLGRIL